MVMVRSVRYGTCFVNEVMVLTDELTLIFAITDKCLDKPHYYISNNFRLFD